MPSLSPLSESTETLTALPDVAYASTIRLGFFPDTALVEAPYPWPGSTSYPGDTTGSTVGEQLTALAEGAQTLTVLAASTETLTPVTEDTQTLTPLPED